MSDIVLDGFEFDLSSCGYESDFRGDYFDFEVGEVTITDRGLIIDCYGIEEAAKLLLDPKQWISENLEDHIKQQFDDQEPDYDDYDLDREPDFCDGPWR